MVTESRLQQRLLEIGREFGHGQELTLARTEAALAALGRPQLRLPPVIHVAGTNGKGSVCAYLRAMAEAAGLACHVYTSPHLVRVNERIRLAGRLVEDAALLAALDRLPVLPVQLTYFEALTVAALLLFAETPADLAVIEVGMGGRFDATNVLTPALSVLTPIDYDHQEFLGPTLAAIAGEKAGILKPGRPALSARQRPEAESVLEAEAARVGAELWRAGVEWDGFARGGRLLVQTEARALDLPLPALPGPHQLENAALAAAAALRLDKPQLSEAAIAAGVANATWPARLQALTRGALAEAAAGAELWIDGGHNPHAARALAAAMAGLQQRRPARLALVWGMLARKEAEAFLAPLLGLAPLVFPVAVTGGGPQPAHAPEALAEFARGLGLAAAPAPDLESAVRAAAAAGAGRILLCGSLFLAGEALARSGMAPE